MPKKYSKKFWFLFWTISILLLLAWYFFLQLQNNKIKTPTSAINYLPVSSEIKENIKSIFYLSEYISKSDGKEKTFMILFQNDMELRPGGGYIGSFGILKIKNGKFVGIKIYDLSIFDGKISSIIEPPYPLGEVFRTNSWKLRDSNWSPDFSENAKRAEHFYTLGGGEEKFDGIFAINSNVFSSFLKVTGPITISDYPGIYDAENGVLNLEYQVEKGYIEQGIKKEERKLIMDELAKIIIEKIQNLSILQKIKMARAIQENLSQKNIQLFFKDEKIQNQIEKSNWAGKIEKEWKKDYLMIVDANLGSYKSDYYMKRSFEYKIDLSKKIPEAKLKIYYKHTGKTKDWMTRDYLSYLRVYAPENSWLTNSKNLNKTIKFGSDFSKKSFGSLVEVPLNQEKIVEFEYSLPTSFDSENYDLLIQKQSGISEIPAKVTIIEKNKKEKSYTFTLKEDWQLSENE